jgi:hypothetical protein
MIDVLIPIDTELGCYEAHKMVTGLLDNIGIPATRYLFCINPVRKGQMILRTSHEITGILGEVRPIPDIGEREYDFCTRVSPMKHIGKKHIADLDLNEWCNRHLSNAQGMHIEKIYARQTMTFCKRKQGFYLPDCIVVGRLRVIDPERTMQTMAEGIGRHRAFGFGLLQLFPLKKD